MFLKPALLIFWNHLCLSRLFRTRPCRNVSHGTAHCENKQIDRVTQSHGKDWIRKEQSWASWRGKRAASQMEWCGKAKNGLKLQRCSCSQWSLEIRHITILQKMPRCQFLTTKVKSWNLAVIRNRHSSCFLGD